MAVLKYYLTYNNDEDLARGLLILFLPFTDEMQDIHTKDVQQVLFENRILIERKRSMFEKYKPMTDLISTINSEKEVNPENNDQNNDESDSEEIETTCLDDINEFNKWAKGQASKDLAKYKNLTSVCDMNQLRLKISSLNNQQRRFFDDLTERCVSTDVNERPVYLFLAGMMELGKVI